MPINIHAVHGDIVEVGANVADMSAPWLCDGFNTYKEIWKKMRARYSGLPLPAGPLLEKPWRSKFDRLLPIAPPYNRLNPYDRLKYLYIFTNPNGAKRCDTPHSLHKMIGRCFRKAGRIGAKSVALINIPVAGYEDKVAAMFMIDGIRKWDAKHRDQLTDVYLVDLTGSFSKLFYDLVAAAPYPPRRKRDEPEPPMP